MDCAKIPLYRYDGLTFFQTFSVTFVAFVGLFARFLLILPLPVTFMPGGFVADDRFVTFVVFVVVVMVFVGMATGNIMVIGFHFGRFRLDLVIMMAVVIFINLKI